jgi:hypothetical protein
VSECDLEASILRRSWHTRILYAVKKCKQIVLIVDFCQICYENLFQHFVCPPEGDYESHFPITNHVPGSVLRKRRMLALFSPEGHLFWFSEYDGMSRWWIP